MLELGLDKQPDDNDVLTLQKCAGVGQPRLIGLYRDALKKYGIIASQLLVTYHNLDDIIEEQNIEARVKDDLENNIVTLINYNDCIDPTGLVLHDKDGNLKVRDNDMLAFKIAHYLGAFRLVMLTNPEANGTVGGSETKTEAIRQAKEKGIEVVVGDYRKGLYNIANQNI